ncbi:hypothetical protein GW17_00053824 [Ensete ventricosum]|nr:hypothetical protein GW17_00053824 [Ensete ventricosum]
MVQGDQSKRRGSIITPIILPPAKRRLPRGLTKVRGRVPQVQSCSVGVICMPAQSYIVSAIGREIVYPCIPDPDREDEGGQVSSLAYLHDGSLQQNSSNLTSQLLRRGREENRRGRPKLQLINHEGREENRRWWLKL